ncbi:hypothetical protein ACIP5Z_01745 [Rothia terrae]|uniref:hypothetical protein n=1 Tax=Rothia terrae TaxID=396015 RepID=UPI0038152CC0
MPNTVPITGKFLDPTGKPLKGTITFYPLPEYVASPQTDTIYMGKVTTDLTDTGEININLITTEAWSYRVEFKLTTQQNQPINAQPYTIQLNQQGNLADLISLSIQDNDTRPTFTIDTYNPGELTLTGAQEDPNDPGAILVPAAN